MNDTVKLVFVKMGINLATLLASKVLPRTQGRYPQTTILLRVFSTLVHHPGTKPNPFVQRAADCVQAMMPEIFDAVWKGEVG